MNRRACVIFVIAFLAAQSRAQDLPPSLDLSINRGLDFLAAQQNPDGSFASNGPRVALTGLGVMSFLAAGHTPDVGKHGLVVRKAVDFLLAAVPDNAYVGQIDNSKMYGHGIVALALAEAGGVETDPARRDKINAALTKMVRLILTAQTVQKDPTAAGGWRYDPQSTDSDLSLSGWNALALRAARDTGQPIPKDAIDRAAAYVLNCYRKETGGFSYQPNGDPTPAMTGVGALNLCLLGQPDRVEVAAAGRFLVEHPVTEQTRFPYYSLYYSTQAAHQIGDATWTKIWTANFKLLTALQQPDGGWPQSHTGEEPGRIYSTALSILSLTVPYQLLPSYQR